MNDHNALAVAIPLVAVETVRHALLDEPLDALALSASLTAGDERLAAALLHRGASFVTLRRADKLRGCIGTLVARHPLVEDVMRNARKAMRDPRMPPVERPEWPDLSISVSVLSPPRPLDVADRAELEGRLKPGVDGLTLRQGEKRATFLPSVWESLTDPAAFVTALLRKGGWESEWPDGMTAEIYGTDDYTSAAPRRSLEES